MGKILRLIPWFPQDQVLEERPQGAAYHQAPTSFLSRDTAQAPGVLLRVLLWPRLYDSLV